MVSTLNGFKNFFTQTKDSLIGSNFCKSIGKKVNWVKERSPSQNSMYAMGAALLLGIAYSAFVYRKDLKNRVVNGFTTIKAKGTTCFQSITSLFSKSKAPEVKKEEVKKQEVIDEEVKKEEVIDEEVKKEEVIDEEVKKEEVIGEEVKKEEVKKEEVNNEEVIDEEVKKEEVKEGLDAHDKKLEQINSIKSPERVEISEIKSNANSVRDVSELSISSTSSDSFTNSENVLTLPTILKPLTPRGASTPREVLLQPRENKTDDLKVSFFSIL